MGELGLDGSIRYVAGTLPMVELAVQKGFKGAILPERSALEAVDFDETLVYGVRTLDDVLRILEEKEDSSDLLIWNTECYDAALREERERPVTADYMDFADILGQESAKRGVEIAAAGGHNLIMMGMDFPPKRRSSGLLYKRRGGDSISTPSLGTCLLYFKSSSYTFSLLNFIGYNSTSSRRVIISNCSKPESTHSITSPSSFLVSLFLI